MTSAAQFLAPEAEVPRDRWGRPVLPHPVTGVSQAWTRATTVADTLSDRQALEAWSQRNVVAGMVAGGKELMLQAAAAAGDRARLSEVVKAALSKASAESAADVGTAIHRVLEVIDSGEVHRMPGDELRSMLRGVPEEYRDDIDSYYRTMERKEVKVYEDWVERLVACPELGAAGTPDRLVMCPTLSALPIIGDIKTGANVIEYGGLKTSAQLAIYAHASHWWDGSAWHEMPPVDKSVGIVMHLPAGTGTCVLYTVDLELGWRIARMSVAARELRKLGKGAFTEL